MRIFARPLLAVLQVSGVQGIGLDSAKGLDRFKYTISNHEFQLTFFASMSAEFGIDIN